MLAYSPTKTQKLLGNPDKSDNPTASSPACAGLAGEHCIQLCVIGYVSRPTPRFAIAWRHGAKIKRDL